MRLFAFERRWLARVLEDVVPGASEVPLERYLDDLTRHAPLEFVLGLRASLWIVVLCPLFVIGRFRSYFGLAHDERLELLERLGKSNVYLLRELPTLFRMVGCLGYCGLPDVQRRFGIETDAEPPAWARGRSEP